MLQAIEKVLDHGRIILGPEVNQFEQQLAAFCGVKYAVGVGSGTDALLIGVKALGLDAGDEVIAPALSFVGTANGIAMGGARPVFADVRTDLTIDPARIEELITPRTKAIMPVHYTGRLADIPALQAICERHGLMLLEDAAPAIGAEYQGQRAGSFGMIGCLSINPMKPLNGMGEAGAVLTNSAELYDRLLALRYNGLVDREYCHYRSGNGRIDTLQAALLMPRIKRLDGWIARRREIAAVYNQRLAHVVDCNSPRPGYRDVFYTYIIQTDRRNELRSWLDANQVETRIHHSLIIPQHPAFLETDLRRYPVALRATNRVLCLPIHEKMSDAEVFRVCDLILEFFQNP